MLNSHQAAVDLLDGRRKIYSHRPILTMAGELIGLDSVMLFLNYGPTWSAHRRLTNFALSPAAKYQTVQADMAALLCEGLANTPDTYSSQLRLMTGRVIMKIVYGVFVESSEDSYIAYAEETLDLIVQAMVPGSFVVDFLPFLKHLPKSTPFIQFHKFASRTRKMLLKMFDDPIQHVLNDIRNGDSTPSFSRDAIVKESLKKPDKHTVEVGGLHLTPQALHDVTWISGGMYGAASETTYGALMTFFLAMTLNPSIQKRAQEELDLVLLSSGASFPTLEHKNRLPFLEAVIKETLRWIPGFPFGLPRRVASDDYYNGYFIPANTTVFFNTWAISRTPGSKYPPEEFHPERFLDADETNLDPRSYVFGFGSRLCPGAKLAENTIYITAASVLSCFDILLPLDKEGKEYTFEPEFSANEQSTRSPLPFPCRIQPRSAEKLKTISERALQCNV